MATMKRPEKPVYPKEFNQKVDMSRIETQVMKKLVNTNNMVFVVLLTILPGGWRSRYPSAWDSRMTLPQLLAGI